MTALRDQVLDMARRLPPMPSAAPDIQIVLPGAPVAKGRARAFGERHVTPKKTRLAELRLRRIGEESMAGRPLMDGALVVSIVAVMPIPRSWAKARRARASGAAHRSRPDGDNLMKLASDALNGVVWTDDARIYDGRVVKIYGEVPGTIINVWEGK